MCDQGCLDLWWREFLLWGDWLKGSERLLRWLDSTFVLGRVYVYVLIVRYVFEGINEYIRHFINYNDSSGVLPC